MPKVKKTVAATEAEASTAKTPKTKKETPAPAKAAKKASPSASARKTSTRTAAATPEAEQSATNPKKAAGQPKASAVETPAQKPPARSAKSAAKTSSAKGKKAVSAPEEAAAQAASLPESVLPESAANVVAKAPKAAAKTKGRKAAAPQTATAESAEQAATKTPAKSATRKKSATSTSSTGGRKATKAEPAQGSAPQVEAESAEAEPVLLEVPKARKGRQKKAAKPAAPEVENAVEGLAGVEPVALEAEPDSEIVPPIVAELPKPRKIKRSKSRGAEAVREEPAAHDLASPSAAQEELAEPAEDAAPSTPEQALITAQLRKLGRPVHVRDLEKTFTRQALDRLGGWRGLGERLEDLVESGAVIRTRKKTYGLPEAMSLVRGRFQSSQAGYGFVIPDSGGEDYYVPEGKTMEAWNGDIVLVRMEGRGDTRDNRGGKRGQRGDGNPRASVVRIVQRAYKQLVGTLEFHHGHPILRPDDHRARHRILLLPEGLGELQAGARVVTELYWPENTGEDEVFGQVVRVLGAEDDPETETEAVIVKYKLNGHFPEDVLAEADAIPVKIPEEALRGRLDLRSFNIFTVDGRDAKDFDDAIHIQPTPEGTFVVGIHIADVSHYVREDTALDHEAYARATSVYLPGRVLPMLPEHLSNGVCSLVPYEDRLTMTALVELSAEGEILKVQLAPSVINSKARLTYDEVQAYSEATATLPEHARHLEGDLHLLLKITTKLRQKRLREGSLDFKLREVKVDVGPDGRMELIPIREETARGMIEDMMLLANKVVAHYLLERDIPTLFRIHEEPTLQRFQEVTGALGRLGLSFPGGEPTPQAYQAVLKQVRGTGRESVVNTLLLRSMQQAKYSGENLGHFGLAFDEYLHFTSPIRRYPDLVVHRTLKHVLQGGWKAGSRAVSEFQARLPALADHTSDRERAAAEAERDLTKYYQCRWALEHLGESFMGHVSGVTASGLYVALENGVEGKLHISYLDDDYYVYLEDAQMLKGRRNGRSFRLGDSVNVTIQAVKPLARQIDLVMADPTDPDYKLGRIDSEPSTQPDPQQENQMDTPVKPRARRREDREAEHREKLKTIQVSAPKKFTLDDEGQAAIQSSPQSAQRQGGYTRSSRGRQQGQQQGQGRASGPTFGGVSMNGRSQSSNQGSGGRPSRRVITLERPRNEHIRPVNITVQRMYFGDWTLDNMPPEEGQSGPRGGRERGYTRQERGERGGNAGSGSGGRGWTRGSSDRGAVQNPNGQVGGQGGGRSQGRAAQSQQAASAAPAPAARPESPQASAQQPSGQQQPSSDEAKRRRRRRGRRPAGSGSNTGAGNE